MNPQHPHPPHPSYADADPACRPATAERAPRPRAGGRTARAGRGLPAVALGVLAGLGVQAGVAPPASAAPQSATTVATAGAGADPAFYDPPADLPAADGSLIRTEALPLALSLPGVHGPLPGKATRLMYKSTDSAGGPVAVTGAYIEPSTPWKGGGPRPVVALAPGTMGQGDQCAASKALGKPLSLDEGSVSIGYENLAIYRFLGKGVAVVVTDYVGLGTTDRPHTYVNRLDGGHAVLDAVRAARALPQASVTADSPVGLYGYSEGGGATASAAELQASYAPEVKLAGSYVGAPPADLTAVLHAVDGSSLSAALGWSINGFLQSEPALKPIVDTHINDKGRTALNDLSRMCIGDGLFAYGGRASSSWTKSGASLADVVKGEPALQTFLARQRLGSLTPSSPVRLATGTSDDLVPHEQARRLAADWCAKGAPVTYVPVRILPLPEKLLNHFLPLIADQGAAVDWVTDRLAGKPATTDCRAVAR
ncbi:lipase family protein [Streptomyces sp. NPDC006464]|uniref:lipase family protein n=1 Tax=Streptomyces sp. NPDC006464 TaxID=3154305 RepID=UPI0033B98D39